MLSPTSVPASTALPVSVNNIKKEEVIFIEPGDEDLKKKKIIQVFPPNNSIKPMIRPMDDKKKKIIKMFPQNVIKVNPVISISSSEESSSSSSSSTSGEEDDDVVMVLSENEGEDEDETVDEDPNNSGSHTNDMFNQADDEGRVMVNMGHPPEEKDIYLAPQLSRAVKPHQIGGIRFLYDNVIESTQRFQTSSGFGCILAHSMGLGKTIQVISFVDIFLRHTSARTVLCIVPINTIQNWMSEFDMWLPQKEAVPQLLIDSNEILPRTFPVFLINDNFKSLAARARALTEWKEKGGVVLMGYEMYRMLALKKLTKVVSRKRKNKKKEDVPPTDTNVEDDNNDTKLLDDIFANLVNPGPDLVVCDEGHRIKNCTASTSTALKKIQTKRRVVLTGYPLQNSLLEYWCMVDFVRPNYLGSRAEFCNMFERPIQNGQCIDSTPKDRQLMRYRAHVLHSLLEGFVQRRGHTVLRCTLPVKEEHVLLIRMTEVQRRLYREFVKDFHSRSNSTNPLLFFAVCCKIWNHPDVLYNFVKNQKHQGLPENDLDIENFVATTPITPEKTSNCKKPGIIQPKELPNHENSEPLLLEAPVNCENKFTPPPPEINLTPTAVKERPDSLISYEWANSLLTTYKTGVLENSYKMLVLFTIIEQSLNVGDKLLVFSQSLLTLDLIEKFLADRYMPNRPGFPPNERWMRNHNYCRLDGKTHAQERERLINCFNRSPTMFLFLLSTRAGCLGINLIGANRIVVFDASWNPCHDAQAVCRIYRYGQQKPCFIYRLVSDNCLEKKVYDRQINKQGMSDRVVDELSPESNFTWKEVSTLVSEEEDDGPEQDFTAVLPKLNDHILKCLCGELNRTLSKEPFEHESLLLDRKDLKLTKQEKKMAKQSYEMEKKGGFGRYNNNYYRGGILRPPFPHGTTIRGNMMYASHGMSGGTRFLPSQSTPVPMQPGQYRPPNKNNNNNSTVLIRALLHQGVMVRRVTPSNDLNVSMSSGESNMVTIPAGQEVLVMRTPKGVYLRVPDGRIIAVRLPPELLSQWQAIGTTTTVGTGDPPAPRNVAKMTNVVGGKGHPFGSQIVQPNLQCGGSVKVIHPNSGQKLDDEGQPEVINLSDEDENGSKKTPPAEGGGGVEGTVLSPNSVMIPNNHLIVKPRMPMGAPRGRPPNPPRIIRVPISSQELRKHNQTGQPPRIIIKQIPKQGGGAPQTVTVMQQSQLAKANQAMSMAKTGMQKSEIPGLTNAKILSALKKGPAGQTITIMRHPQGAANIRGQAMRPSTVLPGQFMKRVVFSGPRAMGPVMLNPKVSSQSGMQIIPITKPAESGDPKMTDTIQTEEAQLQTSHNMSEMEQPSTRTDSDPSLFQMPRIPSSVTITPIPEGHLPPVTNTVGMPPLQSAGIMQSHETMEVTSSNCNPSDTGNDAFEKDGVSINGKHFSSMTSALSSIESGGTTILTMDPQGQDKDEPKNSMAGPSSMVPGSAVPPNSFDAPSTGGRAYGPPYSQSSVVSQSISLVTNSDVNHVQVSSALGSQSKGNITCTMTTSHSSALPTGNSTTTLANSSTENTASVAQSGPTFSQNAETPVVPPPLSSSSSSSHSAPPSQPQPSSNSSASVTLPPSSTSNSSFIRMPDFSQGAGFSDTRFDATSLTSGHAFSGNVLESSTPQVGSTTSQSFPLSSRHTQSAALPASSSSVTSTFPEPIFTDSFASGSSFSSDSMLPVQADLEPSKMRAPGGSFNGQPFSESLSSGSTSVQQKASSSGASQPVGRTTQKSQAARSGQTSTSSTSATPSRGPTEKSSRSSKNATKDSHRSSNAQNDKTSETPKSTPGVSSANQSVATTASNSSGSSSSGFRFSPSVGYPSDPLTFPSEPPLRSFGDEPYRPPEPIGFPQDRSFSLYDQSYFSDASGSYSYGMPNQYSSFSSIPPFTEPGAGVYDSPTYHHLGAPYSGQLQPIDQRSSPSFSYGYGAGAGTSSNSHSYLPNFETLSSPKYNENGSAASGSRQTFPNMQFSPRSHFLSPISSQAVNSSAASTSTAAAGNSQNVPNFSQSQMGYPPSPTQSLANLFSGSIP